MEKNWCLINIKKKLNSAELQCMKHPHRQYLYFCSLDPGSPGAMQHTFRPGGQPKATPSVFWIKKNGYKENQLEYRKSDFFV